MFPGMYSLNLLQAAIGRDTLITRVVADHGAIDYINGILGTIVLLLAAAALVTLILAFVSMKRAAAGMNDSLRRFLDEATPTLKEASRAAADAREALSRISDDIEDISGAAAAIGEPLREGAEALTRRIHDLDAVLDVLQEEFEQTAISSAATMRGIKAGLVGLTAAFAPHRRGGAPEGSRRSGAHRDSGRGRRIRRHAGNDGRRGLGVRRRSVQRAHEGD